MEVSKTCQDVVVAWSATDSDLNGPARNDSTEVCTTTGDSLSSVVGVGSELRRR